MKTITFSFLAVAGLFLLNSCKNRTIPESEIITIVSVKAESVFQGNIEKRISFNGKTIYLKKNIVVSPIAGYIVRSEAKYGEEVKREDVLFEIQTKESKVLGADGAISGKMGTVYVAAPSEGFINELSVNETGGYVVEGGELCTIVNNNDLIVQLNVPYEYNSLLSTGKKCRIILPDNSAMDGFINRILPHIDEVNQTQSVLIRPENHKRIPENLNLTIIFIQEEHKQTTLVSRTSLMANETQTEFWVMKIINDSLAVRIPVLKGIENDSITEIKSPVLGINDLIISEGAYGLPDSTIVKIVK
jgi:hypothetical protein